ncbi:MAG: MFS transporter [Proteobacteria bacterium]|nr:MFS transporter [Pseudomonadota bacterium]
MQDKILKNVDYSIFKNRIVFWSIAAIFYFYEVILRVAPCGITDVLMKDFNLTCTDLGLLVGAYYWAYTLMQIPCGLIVDRIGARRVIALSALICATGTLIFCNASSIYIAILGRILIGVGSACAFISALKVAIDWFSPVHFAMFAGLTNLMGTLGGNFAGLPLAKLMNHIGWIVTFKYLAYIGLFISLLAFLFMRDKQSSLSNAQQISFIETLKDIVKNGQIWLAGIVGGLLYLPITAVAELWGVPFLSTTFSIPHDEAALSTNLIFIGTALGSPIFALIALKLNSYKKTLQFSTFTLIFFFVAFVNARLFHLNYVWAILFIIGLLTGAQVLVFSIAKLESNDKNSATIIGFTNALISFFGILFQPLMGMILDFVWDGKVNTSGIRIYHMDDYQQAMYSMIVAILVSFVVIQKLKKQNIKEV